MEGARAEFTVASRAEFHSHMSSPDRAPTHDVGPIKWTWPMPLKSTGCSLHCACPWACMSQKESDVIRSKHTAETRGPAAPDTKLRTLLHRRDR